MCSERSPRGPRRAAGLDAPGGKRRQTKGAARELRSPAVKLHVVAQHRLQGRVVQGAERLDVDLEFALAGLFDSLGQEDVQEFGRRPAELAAGVAERVAVRDRDREDAAVPQQGRVAAAAGEKVIRIDRRVPPEALDVPILRRRCDRFAASIHDLLPRLDDRVRNAHSIS